MRGLTDFAPLRFTRQQTAVWEDIYEQATRFQLFRDGSVLDLGALSSHIADKICADIWTPQGRLRALPTGVRFSDPGNMIWLGYTLDVVHFSVSRRKLQVKKYRLPDCLWSERLRAVVSFPGRMLPPPEVSSTSLPQMLALYRCFHAGKDPRHGGSRLQTEDWLFSEVHPAAVTCYRSDKFDDDGDWVDYYHPHDTGAHGGHGPLLYYHPQCTMVRGGRLRLTAGGLHH